MNNNLQNQPQSRWVKIWVIIFTTATVCSAVWGFFYHRVMDIKNCQIELLDRQIRIFQTEINVLKDRIKELDSFNDSKNRQEPKSKNLKAKSVIQQDTNRKLLHKDDIYQFPSNEDYSLKIIKVDNLEVMVEFNLKGIKKTETIQINKTRSFLLHGKEYNFILKGISKVNKESVAEFSIIINNIN